MRRKTQSSKFSHCVLPSLIFLPALGFATDAVAQNYANYCAQAPEELSQDLNYALTNNDPNFLATLYLWIGFNTESGNRKMDAFEEMTSRTLLSIDPIYPNAAAITHNSITRKLTPRILTAGFFQADPPPAQTTESSTTNQEDLRGLGELPPLPQTENPGDVANSPSPQDDEHSVSTDDAGLEALQRKADAFDAQLKHELQAMEKSENYPYSSPYGPVSESPPVGFRVQQEVGRFKPKKIITTFGIVRYENCLWLSGG